MLRNETENDRKLHHHLAEQRRRAIRQDALESGSPLFPLCSERPEFRRRPSCGPGIPSVNSVSSVNGQRHGENVHTSEQTSALEGARLKVRRKCPL